MAAYTPTSLGQPGTEWKWLYGVAFGDVRYRVARLKKSTLLCLTTSLGDSRCERRAGSPVAWASPRKRKEWYLTLPFGSDATNPGCPRSGHFNKWLLFYLATLLAQGVAA